jgi:NAD(P)-dependent dehydrogenase (short-subunit alcohol dehydrogenase family)
MPAETAVHSTKPDHAVSTHCRRYEGRVAIVTGAAQGLGRVIARRLAEEGARILVADIQNDRVRRTAQHLQEATGQDFIWTSGDLSEPGVADEMVRRALEAFGQVDTLVNNAAALIRMPLVDFTEELMNKAVQWNVWNTLRCCKAVLPHMMSRKYGRIVNVAGEAWRTGTPFHTLLGGVGKGSMVGLTATLAGEMVASGITVNCISPSAVDTTADGGPPEAADFRDPAWTPPAVMDRLKSMTSGGLLSIGRPAHPTEVAAAAAFFGSPECSYVTGQHLGVSGGRAML